MLALRVQAVRQPLSLMRITLTQLIQFVPCTMAFNIDTLLTAQPLSFEALWLRHS